MQAHHAGYQYFGVGQKRLKDTITNALKPIQEDIANFNKDAVIINGKFETQASKDDITNI